VLLPGEFGLRAVLPREVKGAYDENDNVGAVFDGQDGDRRRLSSMP
jgi:hypothetical protein